MESLTNKDKLAAHPRENGTFVSYLSFRWVPESYSLTLSTINWKQFSMHSWVLPLLLKGRKKNLGLEDLYQPLSQHRATTLGSKLEKSWENEVSKKRAQNKKPSLMTAGLKVFGGQLARCGFFLLMIEMLLKVTSPFFLGKLDHSIWRSFNVQSLPTSLFLTLKYFQSLRPHSGGIVRYYANVDSGSSSTNEPYFYAGGLILCSFLNVCCAHSLMLTQLNIGLKIRISACSLIYRKALRLSKTALVNTTSGQVVNLLSNDVGRFELITMFVHYLWVGPLETVGEYKTFKSGHFTSQLNP